MTPIQFWKSTPRKLHALCEVHAELNNPDDKSKGKHKKQETVFVDQLDFM